LTFNPSIGSREGHATLPSGNALEVHLHALGERGRSITNAVRTVFEEVRRAEKSAREFAARELLAIHNDGWSLGKTTVAKEFIRRLIPATIQVWPDGNAEILFADGGLFWGHNVRVRYSSGVWTEATFS
jgi:hypothetical protein